MLAPIALPKARLEAITDGIFAVTMTLLVLDLKFTERVSHDASKILRDLLAILPYVDDYIISFVVLCVFWLAHLRLIARVREVDATFTWLNLMFLLFTTFVPPLTSWVGEEARQPAAAVVYGSNLILILGFEALMWRRACLHLFHESVENGRALWRQMRARFIRAAVVILAGVVAALIEMRIGANLGLASYVYLLLIGAGIVRARIERGEE